MADESRWKRRSQNIGRRRLGLLVSGQPMDIFFAPRPEWISDRESLACGWSQPVGARGRTETGGRCGRKAFLCDEFARAERLVGHADHGSQSRERPGAEVCSYFGIAPVQVALDATRALSGRQMAVR